MTQTLKAPILAIAFGIAFGFLVALTLTARADVISRVVDRNVELAKFKADCFKIGRLSYDTDNKQWSCVSREGSMETQSYLPINFRY